MRDTGADLHVCRFGQRVVCACRTRTAPDAALITALGDNLDVQASVLDLFAEEAGKDESAAVDHVGRASKELRVHQQRR